MEGDVGAVGEGLVVACVPEAMVVDQHLLVHFYQVSKKIYKYKKEKETKEKKEGTRKGEDTRGCGCDGGTSHLFAFLHTEFVYPCTDAIPVRFVNKTDKR